MTNIAVCNMVRANPKVTLASNKIAVFLAEVLGADLVDDIQKCRLNFPYEYVFVVGGPSAFCNYRDELANMVRNCQYVIFVQNDYLCRPPSQMNKVLKEFGWVDGRSAIIPNVWTTVPECRGVENVTYINWNKVAARDVDWPAERQHGIVYYGMYRDKREKYFRKYFDQTIYPVTISASPRSRPKFEAVCREANFTKVFKDPILEASRFTTALYIEDEYSHNTYTSPAVRFYEYLCAGVAILFDENTVWGMAQAGYDVSPFVVRNQDEVFEKMCNWQKIAAEQTALWYEDFRQELTNEVLEAWSLHKFVELGRLQSAFFTHSGI